MGNVLKYSAVASSSGYRMESMVSSNRFVFDEIIKRLRSNLAKVYIFFQPY